MGNISATQLIILLIIVLLVFGTRRLRNIGSDLGGAIKGFRKGMNENDDEKKRRRRNCVMKPAIHRITRSPTASSRKTTAECSLAHCT